MNDGNPFHRDVYQEEPEDTNAGGSYELVSNIRIGQKPIAKTAKKTKV